MRGLHLSQRVADLFMKLGSSRPSPRYLRLFTVVYILLPLTMLALATVMMITNCYLRLCTILAVISLVLLAKLLTMAIGTIRRGERLRDEFSYLIITSACFVGTGYSLVKLLELLPTIDNLKVFKELSIEGTRFRIFRKWLTAHESLRLIAKYLPSATISRKIYGYVSSMLRGTEDTWISAISREELRELSLRVRTRLSLRAQLALVLILMTCIAPILVIGSSALTGSELVLRNYLLLLLIIVTLGIALTPNLPLHLSITDYPKYSTLISVISLALLCIASINPAFTMFLPYFIAVSVAIGIHRLTYFIRGWFELSKVPAAMTEFLEEVLTTKCISRSLRKCADMISRNPRSWIARFSLLLMRLVEVVGAIEYSVLESLRDTVSLLIFGFREYLSLIVTILIVALASPLIMSSVLALLKAEGVWYSVLSVLSITSAGIIASKYSIDDALNPLIPSVLIIEYHYLA